MRLHSATHRALAGVFLTMLPSLALAQRPRTLQRGTHIDTILVRGAGHEYGLRLGAGQSSSLVVNQRGVDVVLELLTARDSIIETVDSPNGRNGPEVIEVISPRAERYTLRVRPFDSSEPEGRYSLDVTAWRDARETRALLAERERARQAAALWLRRRSMPLPPLVPTALPPFLPPVDSLISRATVLGIGEATHGSREFGDLRLLLTRYLVERLGYRLVAIEASASRLAALNSYVRHEISDREAVARFIEAGWIGRRSLRELVPWLREWNAAHPHDPVRLVGLDPQDSELARHDLRAFLERAYPDAMERYLPVERELAAADSQSWVFGDNSVDSTARQFLQEIVVRGANDAPLLARLFDSVLVRSGLLAARHLLQFADFNAGRGTGTRSRDWYMAANLLEALESVPGTKAVYWAHNAHVAAPGDRVAAGQPMGSWLRAALGCRYGALAVTFGAGAFVAQIPNDLEDDLAVDTLPPAPAETIEAVLGMAQPGGALATWDCEPKTADVPVWLQEPRRMHWVGALFRPGTAPAEAFQPVRLVQDFDGVVFIPRVTADELPTDRPLIPARRRQ